jgi:hypothetical protein
VKSVLERVGERILRAVVPATQVEATCTAHHTVAKATYAYTSGPFVFYNVLDCYNARGCEIKYIGTVYLLSWGSYC